MFLYAAAVNLIPMKIEIFELNHVAIKCADLAASMIFYGQVLGLQQIERPAFDFAGAWFALGHQELHLIEHVLLQHDQSRENHHFALKVPNAFEAKKILAEKGLTGMRGPKPRPDGMMQLFITDPDGYVIELFSEGRSQ